MALTTIIHFLFGEPDQRFYALVAIIAMHGAIYLYTQIKNKKKIKPLRDIAITFEKVGLYIFFFILANMMDVITGLPDTFKIFCILSLMVVELSEIEKIVRSLGYGKLAKLLEGMVKRIINILSEGGDKK